jgi:uncharacterized SAM-binding protein YcdF (DUF218 family)
VKLDRLIVLGCRVARGGGLSAPAERRVRRAARAYHEGRAVELLVCGGKRWQGVREADAFAAALVALGVPHTSIERELRSRSTLQNARCAAALVPPEQRRVGLVTCDWHMPRALRCFRAAGFEPESIAAHAPALPRLATRARTVREWASLIIDTAFTSWLSEV